VLAGVGALVGAAVWAMVVLSRPARAERLLRVDRARLARRAPISGVVAR
jgi:hypothetical protein